jgi:TonB family protein
MAVAPLLAILVACVRPEPPVARTTGGRRPREPRQFSPAEVAALVPVLISRKSGYALVEAGLLPRLAPPEGPVRRGTVRAEAKICVHPDGDVYEATITRSTGTEEYDRAMLQDLRGWHHRPYLKEGRSVAFCYLFATSFTSL